MVKRIGRRFVSLLLTFVTILTMLPAMTLPALAADSGTLNLPDKSIGLSYSGDADGAWTTNGTSITGAATSTGGCSTTHYSSTLTIKNEGSTTARLSFSYTVEVNEGTILVDKTKVTANGTFTKELALGDTVEVKIKSGSTAATKITMTDVKLEAGATATVTFQPAENGSYTVDGKDITTEAYTNTQSSLTAYKVIATPADGYQFLGWYDATNKSYLPGGASSSIFVSSGDSKVTAKFGKIGTKFQVGTTTLKWDNLNDAIISTRNNSSGYVKQLESCTISGEYTIPSGVTLLIPFDETEALYTTTPAYTTTAEAQKAYKTLTMAPDSSITVDGGAISVGGKHFTSSGRECCKPTGAYGLIKMQKGSSIMLNNGANLYAWGYITGDGSITANSGANVYEYYQVTDWRGGSQTSNMANNEQKVFPFTQYYVQNIEAALTLNAGANEYTYISVTAKFVGTKSVTIPFVGSNGLFKLGANGQFTKRYIPAQDRMVFTISGEASLNSIVMSLAGIATFDSKDYVLPINNNVDIVITDGTTTIEKDAALLPGVTVLIAKDAELKVASTASLYVYDDAEWSPDYVWGSKSFGSSGICPVSYSPSGKGSRGIADAKVDVNGVLTVAGAVYTTATGANITSSEKTGKYAQVGTPGTSNKTYQFNQESNKYIGVDITAAKLKNIDDSYTETASASAGQTIPYCTCPTCGGKWLKDFAAIIDSTDNKTTYHPTLQEAVKQFPQDSNGNTYIKMLHSTTEKTISVNNKNLRLDLNGRTVTGDISVTNGYKLYGMDSSVSKDYVTAPSGKIVGTVTGTVAPTYETPKVTTTDGDTYDRYVAIPGTENGTSTLSFHHFNISVTGYRFELATGGTPQCALFFIGKFQGDKAAKDYLTSLGFTLKDENVNQLGEDNYKFTAGTVFPPMPKEGEASNSKVVCSGDAYLFEAYLKRSFDKAKPDGYTKNISATAQATFQNGGTQQSDPRNLSFEDAWKNAEGLDAAQQEILDRFLDDLGITK